MLIIRRVSCINTISGICHCMQVTVWCTGLPAYHTVTYIYNAIYQVNLHTTRSPTYTVTYTRDRIDTIDSFDDEHLLARNMYGIGINKFDVCVTVHL